MVTSMGYEAVVCIKAVLVRLTCRFRSNSPVDSLVAHCIVFRSFEALNSHHEVHLEPPSPLDSGRTCSAYFSRHRGRSSCRGRD